MNMVSELLTVSVSELVQKTRLVGSAMGRADNLTFASKLQQVEPGILCFDWSQIELATGSYFKAAYLPLFRAPHGVPIVTAGLNGETREELELALQSENRPLLFLAPNKSGKSRSLSLLGSMDDAYERTLVALKRNGVATATELHQESLRELPQIGKTAWINRLNRLYEMGLIVREKAGKGYRYSNIAV